MTVYVMGTGSRSMVTAHNARAIYDDLRRYVLLLAEQFPGLTLITGMAEGWDEAIAKVGLREGIPYIAYVPHRGYGDYYWRKNSLTGKDRFGTFLELLNGAKQVHYVCPTIYVGRTHSNFVRNQAMVDACTFALVFDAQSSGTKDAVRKLIDAEKPVRCSPFFDKQGNLRT